MSNVKKTGGTVDFSKLRSRDNIMYKLTEGFNLENKDNNFVDKYADTDVGPVNRKLAYLL